MVLVMSVARRCVPPSNTLAGSFVQHGTCGNHQQIGWVANEQEILLILVEGYAFVLLEPPEVIIERAQCEWTGLQLISMRQCQ